MRSLQRYIIAAIGACLLSACTTHSGGEETAAATSFAGVNGISQHDLLDGDVESQEALYDALVEAYSRAGLGMGNVTTGIPCANPETEQQCRRFNACVAAIPLNLPQAAYRQRLRECREQAYSSSF